MDEVSATLISTAVSSFIASGVAFATVQLGNRAQERQSLYDMVAKMIDLSMQYPFVEQDKFRNNWPNVEASDDDKGRYDNYCCFAFNVLERLWLYANSRNELGCGQHESMSTILHPEEVIKLHQKWWESEDANKYGYDSGFRQFVSNILSKK